MGRLAPVSILGRCRGQAIQARTRDVNGLLSLATDKNVDLDCGRIVRCTVANAFKNRNGNFELVIVENPMGCEKLDKANNPTEGAEAASA